MAAPVGPNKVHRYALEFKIQAVRLANHPDIETQDVAHALDIHPFLLSKWKKDYREGKLKPAGRCPPRKRISPVSRAFVLARVERRALRVRACARG
jgi:transposase-like protein